MLIKSLILRCRNKVFSAYPAIYIRELQRLLSFSFRIKKYYSALLLLFSGFITLIFCCLTMAHSSELLEATVATVEDDVITLSEFNERYEVMKRSFPDISKKEVLEMIINRLLLLREARLSRIAESRGLSHAEEDRIIEEYIDIKIRSSIRISEEEIHKYYETHKVEFRDIPFQDVAEKIEVLLIEKRTNELLKEHIEELKKKAYIVINNALLQAD